MGSKQSLELLADTFSKYKNPSHAGRVLRMPASIQRERLVDFWFNRDPLHQYPRSYFVIPAIAYSFDPVSFTTAPNK